MVPRLGLRVVQVLLEVVLEVVQGMRLAQG